MKARQSQPTLTDLVLKKLAALGVKVRIEGADAKPSARDVIATRVRERAFRIKPRDPAQRIEVTYSPTVLQENSKYILYSSNSEGCTFSNYALWLVEEFNICYRNTSK